MALDSPCLSLSDCALTEDSTCAKKLMGALMVRPLVVTNCCKKCFAALRDEGKTCVVLRLALMRRHACAKRCVCEGTCLCNTKVFFQQHIQALQAEDIRAASMSRKAHQLLDGATPDPWQAAHKRSMRNQKLENQPRPSIGLRRRNLSRRAYEARVQGRYRLAQAYGPWTAQLLGMPATLV